jgi:hypothetical protein
VRGREARRRARRGVGQHAVQDRQQRGEGGVDYLDQRAALLLGCVCGCGVGLCGTHARRGVAPRAAGGLAEAGHRSARAAPHLVPELVLARHEAQRHEAAVHAQLVLGAGGVSLQRSRVRRHSRRAPAAAAALPAPPRARAPGS